MKDYNPNRGDMKFNETPKQKFNEITPQQREQAAERQAEIVKDAHNKVNQSHYERYMTDVRQRFGLDKLQLERGNP